MRNKKIVQIKNFNNFNNETNDAVTQKFYNYYPSSQLNNSKGIAPALFPKSFAVWWSDPHPCCS